MKKLVITIPDEELVKVLSAVVKTNASFTVEHMEEAPVSRKRQVYSPEGKRSSDIFLEAITNAPSKRVSKQDMRRLFEENGFAANTAFTTAQDMRAANLIVNDGDYWRAA